MTKKEFACHFVIGPLLMVSLSGCAFLREATTYHPAEAAAEQYRVNISALSSTDEHSNGRAFFLASALKDTPESDLQFREYAAYLQRALESQGYRRTQDPATADLLIFLAYGIGDPQTVHYSYAVPAWGQTGISGAYTFGNSTVFTPSFGVTGYIPVSGSETYFFRYARVDCYDYAAFRKDKKEHPLWRTDIKSTGSNGDLRRVMPVLIAAAIPYFGENTGVEVAREFDTNDDSLAVVRGFAPAEPPSAANAGGTADTNSMPQALILGVIKNAKSGAHLKIISVSNAVLSGKLRQFARGTLIIDEDQGGGLSLDLTDIKSVVVTK